MQVCDVSLQNIIEVKLKSIILMKNDGLKTY